MPSLSKFERRLSLVTYFRHLFGVEDPLDPSAVQGFYQWLNDLPEGRDEEGRSHVYKALKERVEPPLKDRFLAYDKNVGRHLKRLNEHREQDITLRYFQTLAALMTEVYLDRVTREPEAFLEDINAFLHDANEEKGRIKFPKLGPTDLQKVAYWMATGSGKTLLLHLNYYQFMDYRGDEVDHILLVTPNEGLSDQHQEAMAKSGVPCYHFIHEGSSALLEGQNPVKVLEITKLTDEKTGEGVRVEVESFEGDNLVFVDEGHKGTGSTAETWRSRRQELAGDQGFTFEYSATFGQAMSKATASIEEEYGKSILFDYSYPRFYDDGYGKDYRILNLEDDFNEDLTRRYLLANLLTFYEQSRVFDRHTDTLRGTYNIAAPLLIFIGHSVVAGKTRSELSTNDKKSISDVQELVNFLRQVLQNQDNWVPEAIDAILAGEAGLSREDGRSLFADSFSVLQDAEVDGETIYTDLLQRFFHVDGSAGLHLVNLKGGDAEGEIGLRAGQSAPFFGVINIGDETNFLNGVEEKLPEIDIRDSQFEGSLFKEVNRTDSDIQVLIGAKKFIEGWSSWRVSTMGLMNIGRSEGSQIIQLFGRGVRLKGKDLTLKRSSALDGSHPDYLPLLERLHIFGIRADYMADFRDYLADEGIDVEERETVEIETKTTDAFQAGDLLTIRPGDEETFVESVQLQLSTHDDIAPSLDLSTSVELIASGENGQHQSTASAPTQQVIEEKYLSLLDWDRIYQEIWSFRSEKGFENLAIGQSVLRKIIEEERYELTCSEDLLQCQSYRHLRRIEEIVIMLLQKHVSQYYAMKEKAWEDEQLQYQTLDLEDPNFVDHVQARIKRSSDLLQEMKSALEDEALYENEKGFPPRVHFDQHLYHPLLKDLSDSAGEDDVKYSPPGLNEGEWRFVADLKDYLCSPVGETFMADKELYLLRNQSRGHGVGFLVNNGRYYPDFILWLHTPDEKHIAFIDPKGLNFVGNLMENDKVQFARKIKDYEQALGEEGHSQDVHLHAFVVSRTSFQTLRAKSALQSKEDFREHHILFPEGRDPDSSYINDMLNGIAYREEQTAAAD